MHGRLVTAGKLGKGLLLSISSSGLVQVQNVSPTLTSKLTIHVKVHPIILNSRNRLAVLLVLLGELMMPAKYEVSFPFVHHRAACSARSTAPRPIALCSFEDESHDRLWLARLLLPLTHHGHTAEPQMSFTAAMVISTPMPRPPPSAFVPAVTAVHNAYWDCDLPQANDTRT
eukprot:2792857-Amphidinium_carterae.2